MFNQSEISQSSRISYLVTLFFQNSVTLIRLSLHLLIIQSTAVGLCLKSECSLDCREDTDGSTIADLQVVFSDVNEIDEQDMIDTLISAFQQTGETSSKYQSYNLTKLTRGKSRYQDLESGTCIYTLTPMCFLPQFIWFWGLLNGSNSLRNPILLKYK